MDDVAHDDLLVDYPEHVLLKKGGQKVAYRIKHSDYGDAVIKIGTYSSPESLERIKREVSTLRAIDSPYYPKNYDFQIVSQNRFIIYEEYVLSKPLSECLTSFSSAQKVIELLSDIVTGLSVLWDSNIVHRDVKPDNILITPGGKPKIIDLGIARLLDLSSLTNSMYGGPCTPAYAAPEQLVPRQVPPDARTDQFALGIVVLQLILKGQHPFDPSLVGNAATIPQNILADRWHRASLQEPDALAMAPIIKKLLGHEPHNRFRTTSLLVSAINATRTSLI
ncbi:MAG: serine/threonine-protein kinase [Janthinobacterium lividum]